MEQFRYLMYGNYRRFKFNFVSYITGRLSANHVQVQDAKCAGSHRLLDLQAVRIG